MERKVRKSPVIIGERLVDTTLLSSTWLDGVPSIGVFVFSGGDSAGDSLFRASLASFVLSLHNTQAEHFTR
jgi:hypothetical protein